MESPVKAENLPKVLDVSDHNDSIEPSKSDKEPETETPPQEESHQVDISQISYLNRGEYSSELFKLEVKNLPTNFGFGVILRNEQIQQSKYLFKT